jgi:hypothetical protein
MVEEDLMRKLIAIIKCGLCGRHYNNGDIKALSHKEDFWFLSASCSACKTRSMVAVIIKNGKPPELVTDLTEEELSAFEGREATTADEVLDMHNFLKDFSGDISNLFASGEKE